jgi:major type 1 subunit fimbrin (pilin)
MKKTILASLLTVAVLGPLPAFASDGTITFTGAVTAQTCTINGGAPSFTKALPKVSSANLTSGKKAGQTNFSIALTACTPKSGSARVFFEAGPNVNAATGRLKNTSVTNVEIGLANADGTDITIGAPSGLQGTDYVKISDAGDATLNYLAQYVATGAAGTGDVKTSVTYSVEYQ